MKKIILLTSYLFVSSAYAENIPSFAHQLVPKDWQIISHAIGDLNQDKVDDIALLLKPKKSDISGPKIFIYFNKNNKYILKFSKEFDGWIYGNKQECIGSAFDETSLTIQHNVLNIKFNDEPICFNTYGINYTYKFKYEQNHFKLIGFDSLSGDKISGNTSEISVNYLSNKVKIYHYNFIPHKEFKPKIVWKKLKNKETYNLENMLFDTDDYNLKFEDQYK